MAAAEIVVGTAVAAGAGVVAGDAIAADAHKVDRVVHAICLPQNTRRLKAANPAISTAVARSHARTITGVRMLHAARALFLR
jgi:hypothetical protein